MSEEQKPFHEKRRRQFLYRAYCDFMLRYIQIITSPIFDFSVRESPLSKTNFAVLSLFLALPITAYAERWQQVMPGEPDSAQVDLDSVGPYIELTRAMIRTPKIYPYRRPAGLKLPPGATDNELIEVQCNDGAIGYTVERRILNLKGKVLYRNIPDPVKTQKEILQMYEMSGGKYGQTVAGLVCAYAASRCTKTPFKWPIQSANPLYGQGVAKTPEEATARIARYVELSDQYNEKFKPKCTGAEHAQ